MITPIRTMTITEILERPDDLLIGKEDLDRLGQGTKEKTIDRMVEGIKEILKDNAIYNIDCIITLAEQLKGERNESRRDSIETGSKTDAL